MRKSGWLVVGALVVLGLALGAWYDAGAQETAKKEEAPSHEIIGAKKCNMCHKMDKYGNQAAVWENGPHAKAYEALASDEAKKIATEKELGDPQKAKECLACHTTQYFWGDGVKAQASYELSEGVGCETCHGPGSDYKSMSVMKDPAKAKAAGLITPDAETCKKCHNEKSPTFKSFDFDKMWPKIAHPIPAEG